MAEVYADYVIDTRTLSSQSLPAQAAEASPQDPATCVPESGLTGSLNSSRLILSRLQTQAIQKQYTNILVTHRNI